MSYLEQLQIKKEPVKNSDFVIRLLSNSESKQKEGEEKLEEKVEEKVDHEESNVNVSYNKDDVIHENDPIDKSDVEPPSVIPFFVDKTKETRLNLF